MPKNSESKFIPKNSVSSESCLIPQKPVSLESYLMNKLPDAGGHATVESEVVGLAAVKSTFCMF